MGGREKPGIELRISCSDTMLNYRLFQKLKLLRNGEFNHLTISLTLWNTYNKEIGKLEIKRLRIYGDKEN